MNKTGSFFLGFIFGAVTGGVLTLLFTPSSGQTMRETIQQRYGKLRNDVNEAAAQRTRELREDLARLQKRETAAE
jgi:gas vesicle protein